MIEIPPAVPESICNIVAKPQVFLGRTVSIDATLVDTLQHGLHLKQAPRSGPLTAEASPPCILDVGRLASGAPAGAIFNPFYTPTKISTELRVQVTGSVRSEMRTAMFGTKRYRAYFLDRISVNNAAPADE